MNSLEEQLIKLENDLMEAQKTIETQKEAMTILEEECAKKDITIKTDKEDMERQVIQLKILMNNKVNDTIQNLSSNFQLKEKKLISKICKEVLKHLVTFKEQLLAYYSNNNEELLSIISILDSNITTLFGDFNIIMSDVQIGDKFNSSKHTISSIITTDDESLHDTVANIINRGFVYSGDVLSYDNVQVYKC